MADPLELKTIVNHHVGTEPGSSARVLSALKLSVISPVPPPLILDVISTHAPILTLFPLPWDDVACTPAVTIHSLPPCLFQP